jgi:ATP-dependent Clp protease ATP-binding subunit ClpC
MSDSETPTPTPRYHRVLAASAELARESGHAYIGVEHLFLAIVRDRAAVPTQVLARITDLDTVEASVARRWRQRATGENHQQSSATRC